MIGDQPPFARQKLNQEILRSEPAEQFELDGDAFLVVLEGCSAGCNSWTLGDDRRPPGCSSKSHQGWLLVTSLRRWSRLTALAKPDGGVRGIVVGDIVRRLVATTMAKQVAKKAEKATAPFQCALSTRAGCECVAHIVQALTDQDVNATVVTVDGVGTYDLISKNAMLEGFLRMEGGDQIFPFARLFHGTPSTYLWEDKMENTQEIPQGEGGEQGDPPHAKVVLFGRAPSFGGHPEKTSR